MTEAACGFLILHKPSGLSSFACVARVRRLLGVRRVGHTGTLDPAASGVLILLVGPATRTQEHFLALTKQYRFIAEVGRQTTTGDCEGDVSAERPWDKVTAEALHDVLRGMIGTSLQTPPLYAALKYKGRPYYDYARRGETVPRVSRPITIDQFDLLSWAPPLWEARVRCSRGTYVRVLAEDVAARMGTVGTLRSLVREAIGPYTLEEALPWAIIERGDAEALRNALRESPSLVGAHSHAA